MHGLRILILAGLAGAGLAQTPAEDQRKAKLAAERNHTGGGPNVAPGRPGLEQKRAAEAMYTIVSAAGGGNRTVKGKPFTASSTTETVQTLADGNQIIFRNRTRYFRDRDGRTRREQVMEKLGSVSATVIVISDPVAKFDYILDPEKKTARRFARVELGGPARASEGVDTGRRTIAGVECDGRRKVATIPAGEIGNVRPIEIVTETWWAEAIEAVTLSTVSDPRFGETKYELDRVELGEPARELFMPPADYRIVVENGAR